MSVRTPSYRMHRPSGQAVVTLNGRDYYLGKHGTPESRAEYDRLVGQWLASGRQVQAKGATDITVNELILGYLRHADAYYTKNGEPTGEATTIRYALRPLRQLYGHTIAADFGPLALKTCRESMVTSGLCRNEVNRRTRIIARAFRWAVENELVPAAVHSALRAVPGLRKGRTEARESDPVGPVSDEHIEAVMPFLAPAVATMVRLMRLTGARPGEMLTMRTGDIDRSEQLWVYRPGSHKTEHHGRDRVVYIGPRAQEFLKPWLRADPDAFLFSPAEAMEQRWARRRSERQSPMTPSQSARTRKVRPKKRPGARYTNDSLRQAVAGACKRAGVPPFSPNRIRHTAATAIRARYGLEAAQTVLGHARADVTQVYAERNRDLAAEVIAQVG